MSVVKDLSTLPIGTKVEMIADEKIVHILHTTSLYEDFHYLLVDENGNEYALTIKDLLWGNFKINFSEIDVKKDTIPKNYY